MAYNCLHTGFRLLIPPVLYLGASWSSNLPLGSYGFLSSSVIFLSKNILSSYCSLWKKNMLAHTQHRLCCISATNRKIFQQTDNMGYVCMVPNPCFSRKLNVFWFTPVAGYCVSTEIPWGTTFPLYSTSAGWVIIGSEGLVGYFLLDALTFVGVDLDIIFR